MTPNDHPQLHVVLGATGGIGGAITHALVAQGLPTRAVSRSGKAVASGADAIAADVSDPEQARRAVEGASVVYHAAMPAYHRWVQEFPAMNRSIIEAVRSADARLVYVDNLYLYGPAAEARTEETPQRATDKKGVLRAKLADELLEAHARGESSVVIGRLPDYFGPGGLGSATGELFFDAAVRGKTVRWLGDLDSPHSLAYLPDIGRAFVTLGTDDAAVGRAWHLPIVGSPTGRELAAAASKALQRKVKISATGKTMLRLVGLFDPAVRETAEMLYQWEQPFLVSDGAFQQAFGPQVPTPLDDAVAVTIEWFETRRATTAT
jgi:nucleoside-diphosphate-sugar epimerase